MAAAHQRRVLVKDIFAVANTQDGVRVLSAGQAALRDQSCMDCECIKLNDCLYRVVRVNMHISAMEAQTQILKVEKDGEDGLIVTFSDGTTAGYVVEELLGLRPLRERVQEPLKSDRPTTIVTKIRFSVGAPYST